MKKWQKYCAGLAALIGSTPIALGQAPAVPTPPAAPAAGTVVNVTQSQPQTLSQWLGCPSKAACQQALCQSQLGALLGNGLSPVSLLSGGIIPPLCPGNVPSAADLAGAAKDPGGPQDAANQIKASEAGAAARKAAVQYLGTVDCRYFPAAGVALVKALLYDTNECVRLAAAQALQSGCCCNKETIAALRIVVTAELPKDFKGKWAPEGKLVPETSERVKWTAEAALEHCLACFIEPAPPVPPEPRQPEKPPVRRPEALPEPTPQREKPVGRSARSEVTDPCLVAFYAGLENMTLAQVIEDARTALARRAGKNPGMASIPTGSRSVYQVLHNAVFPGGSSPSASSPATAVAMETAAPPASPAPPIAGVMTAGPAPQGGSNYAPMPAMAVSTDIPRVPSTMPASVPVVTSAPALAPVPVATAFTPPPAVTPVAPAVTPPAPAIKQMSALAPATPVFAPAPTPIPSQPEPTLPAPGPMTTYAPSEPSTSYAPPSSPAGTYTASTIPALAPSPYAASSQPASLPMKTYAPSEPSTSYAPPSSFAGTYVATAIPAPVPSPYAASSQPASLPMKTYTPSEPSSSYAPPSSPAGTYVASSVSAPAPSACAASSLPASLPVRTYTSTEPSAAYAPSGHAGTHAASNVPASVPGAHSAPGVTVSRPDLSNLVSIMYDAVSPFERERAAATLANMSWEGRSDAVAGLLIATSDQAAVVRVQAVRTLSRRNVGTPQVISTIRGLQNDPDPRVRHEVGMALNHLDGSRAMGQSDQSTYLARSQGR